MAPLLLTCCLLTVTSVFMFHSDGELLLSLSNFEFGEKLSPLLLESGEHEQFLFFTPPLASLIQLNPNVNAFQRKFVGEVRRCEELEKTFCKCLLVNLHILFSLTSFYFGPFWPPLSAVQPSWSRRSIAPCPHPCSGPFPLRVRHLWPLSPASWSP